jgi:SAM-dependent methyltransferase
MASSPIATSPVCTPSSSRETRMAEVPLYDRFAAGYDLMTDWEARLKSEAGFLRQLFERFQVHTVLDAACGTGQHAIEFARWGLEVTGTDLSGPMIDRARENAGALPVRFLVVGLGPALATRCRICWTGRRWTGRWRTFGPCYARAACCFFRTTTTMPFCRGRNASWAWLAGKTVERSTCSSGSLTWGRGCSRSTS